MKPSFPFELQGQIIGTKDTVKYVGLPLSLATWEDKNYFAMLKEKKNHWNVALKFRSKQEGIGLDNYFVSSSFKEDRPVEEQGTSTSNNHNPVCGTTGPSLENLTVPPLPREAPTNQPSCSLKMCYQQKSCGP